MTVSEIRFRTRRAIPCFIVILILAACASSPTLMPTAVPPEIAASATVALIAPTATPQPTIILPPTWTPPPPTPLPPPLSVNDLAALLLEVGDFEPGVLGNIQRSLQDSALAQDMVATADAAIFQEFEDLEGMVGVAFYQSGIRSQRLYQSIFDWMYDTALDDYGQGITASTHEANVGEEGFAVELYTPPYTGQVYTPYTWNVPGGNYGGWVTVTEPAQYVSYMVFTRCNTVTYIQIRASLMKLRSYAYRLDARLLPLVCGQNSSG